MNISLAPGQRAWLVNRRDTGGYASTNDVVQDLIRQAQQAEQKRLRREFANLVERSPGAAGAEPVGVVVRAARRTKRRHRLARRVEAPVAESWEKLGPAPEIDDNP